MNKIWETKWVGREDGMRRKWQKWIIECFVQLWHGVSKTMAEKSAWALAMDRGVNMVSINAGLLMTHDLSIQHPYLRGAAEMYEDGVFVTVDLPFLVDAHICVYEEVSSYGRYLCFNHIINTHDDAVQLAQKLTPAAGSSSSSSSSPSPQRSEDFFGYFDFFFFILNVDFWHIKLFYLSAVVTSVRVLSNRKLATRSWTNWWWTSKLDWSSHLPCCSAGEYSCAKCNTNLYL